MIEGVPLKASRVSAGLIGVVATTAAGAVALGGKGAKDLLEAHKRETAANEMLHAREDQSGRGHDKTNGRVAALGQLEEECLTSVVDRLRDFLRRHEKQVRNRERLLADGIDVTIQLLEPPKRNDAADVGVWTAGAAGSVVLSVRTGAAVNELATNFGSAGTGKKISELKGAAREKALKAFLGGGPKANGGGGIARGELIRKALIGSAGMLTGAVVTQGMGTKALTEAQKQETTVEVACANLDRTDASLSAIDQRVEELTTILNKLRVAALTELDALESAAFEIEQHAPQLQKAMTLALAVREVATTPLLRSGHDLDGRSESVTVKYRLMLKETDGD